MYSMKGEGEKTYSEGSKLCNWNEANAVIWFNGKWTVCQTDYKLTEHPV